MVKVIALFSKDFLNRVDSDYINLSELDADLDSSLVFQANDPEASDDTLSRYYSIEVKTVSDAEKLVDTLLGLPEVEASWVKPNEGPPQ